MTKKTIYITGGCGLLGRSFAQRLLADGYNVVLADINQESGDKFLNELNSSQILFIKTDIACKESLRSSLAQAVNRFGSVDVLVNSAYPRNPRYGRKLFEVEYCDFVENVSSNLGGLFLTSQVFAEYFMAKKAGHIINIASIYGVIAPKFEIYEDTKMTMPVEYAAIKSAVIHLSKYFAKYLKGSHVRVNTLTPGGLLDGQDEKFLAKYNEQCLSKGMLNPVDMYGTLKFLISTDSQYINGQNIIVDDGFTL